MFEVIDTGSEPADIPVSEVVRAGNLVWSVHISENPVTGELVLGDIEMQTGRTLQNLEIAIRAAGGSLADIVQLQVFLVEKDRFGGNEQDICRVFQGTLSRTRDRCRQGTPVGGAAYRNSRPRGARQR